MEWVRVGADHKCFVLESSGRRFVPWGHNYASGGIDDPAPRSWGRIESDLSDLHDMGANVIRIHLHFPEMMDAPGNPNHAALDRLSHLLELAQKHGIYLDITGLACYRKDKRAAWYDALPDERRWAVQAKFWEAVARTCASSPAVFCYDLMNEPIASGKRSDGWYTGAIGNYEFIQRLSLDQPNRSGDGIARRWTHTQVAAIRKADPRHLITIGMLPAWGINPRIVGAELDFISVHIYPTTGKVDDAIKNLKQFDIGKPIVVEETFPLSCGVDDERSFLLKSRGIACGWIGHYPEEPLSQLQSLKREGKLTPGQALYMAWLDLFREMGPQMQTGT